jgi:hypothetical protein
VCILYSGCFNLFCNVWVSLCGGVLTIVCVCVCVCVLVICVLVFTVFSIVCTVFFIVSLMYNYSYLFCLY